MFGVAQPAGRVGPYILTRELATNSLGPRWLALRQPEQTSHVVQTFDGADAQTFEGIMARAAGLKHRHICLIEQSGVDPTLGCWAATPFTGDQDGVLSLERLLRLKGGFMEPIEARRAMRHLLDGISAGHAAGLAHGAIELSDVLVSRGGSVQIDFYGVRTMIGGKAVDDELVREEVRSAARIGYQLVSGLRVEDPFIPAGRIVEGLDPSWDDWFETALGRPGFTTAAHALHALSSCRVSFEVETLRRKGR